MTYDSNNRKHLVREPFEWTGAFCLSKKINELEQLIREPKLLKWDFLVCKWTERIGFVNENHDNWMEGPSKKIDLKIKRLIWKSSIDICSSKWRLIKKG